MMTGKKLVHSIITSAQLYRIYSVTKKDNNIDLNLSDHLLVLVTKYKNYSSRNVIRVDMTKIDNPDFSFKYTSQITK